MGCRMDKLTRIRQLIALTASRHEEEARTAAFQACRMIREGGFQVVAGQPEAAAPFRYASPSYTSEWDDIFRRATRPTTSTSSPPSSYNFRDVGFSMDDIFREAVRQNEANARARAAKPPINPFAGEKTKSTADPFVGEQVTWGRLEYARNCRHCGRTIAVGTNVWSVEGRNAVWCESCGPMGAIPGGRPF